MIFYRFNFIIPFDSIVQNSTRNNAKQLRKKNAISAVILYKIKRYRVFKIKVIKSHLIRLIEYFCADICVEFI